ncbi:MAG: hypothetical protein LBE13_05825 [Bacteroidales bacterium]|jgi:hypoxanthine phosphoribosyltransferase|nr:hypothetical protein [Bacteroidales bacterium]
MRVITLLNEDFNTACKDLTNKIKNSFIPDIIVSIPTGGRDVGKMILKELDNKDILYAEIKVQRNTTKIKEIKIIHYVIKNIPKFLANWIRILEIEIMLIKLKFKKTIRTGTVELDENIDAFLKQGYKNILVVDDAIDSGSTVEFICSYIKKNYPTNIIKIAVITVTTNKPLVDADYFLYHNRTLVRFPWSHDA